MHLQRFQFTLYMYFFLEVLSLASKRTGITFLQLDSLGG